MRIALSLFGLFAFVGLAACSDDKPADPRLQHLLDLADKLRMEVPGEESVVAKRHDSPLLRYTNPLYAAHSDGALFMWVDDGLPVAFASYSIRSDKDVFRELSVLSESGLRCQHDGNVVWAPDKSGFARRAISRAPAPPENERLRLTHMKRIADRIGMMEMRRLATPLYRYSSEKHCVVEGAVFTLVRANDPKLLIIVEAFRDDSDKLAWRYCLARMNSSKMSVTVDDKQVWEWKKYWSNPKSPSDPYVEQWNSKLPADLSQAAVADDE